MGKRGPAPEPSILRYIRGNPSKAPMNDGEPVPEAITNIEPPEEIADDPLAVRKWNKTVPMLLRMRVFTAADTDAWTIYCRTWACWMRAKAKCEQFGRDNITTEPDPADPSKRRIKWTQPYTWSVEERSLANDLRRLQQEFGLTPSSRSQVDIHDSPSEDPIGAYNQGRSEASGA